MSDAQVMQSQRFHSSGPRETALGLVLIAALVAAGFAASTQRASAVPATLATIQAAPSCARVSVKAIKAAAGASAPITIADVQMVSAVCQQAVSTVGPTTNAR